MRVWQISSFGVDSLEFVERPTPSPEAGEVLGLFKDVISSKGQDVWMVQGRVEYLVPALKSVVLNVDLTARKITVRLPPGLREIKIREDSFANRFAAFKHRLAHAAD